MVEKFFKWLISHFSPEVTKDTPSLFDDREFKAIMLEKRETIERAEKIVGKSPMEQIDYTIKHGFEKFNQAYQNNEPETKEKSIYEIGSKTPAELKRETEQHIEEVKLDIHGINYVKVQLDDGNSFRIEQYDGWSSGKRVPRTWIQSNANGTVVYDYYSKCYYYKVGDFWVKAFSSEHYGHYGGTKEEKEQARL